MLLQIVHLIHFTKKTPQQYDVCILMIEPCTSTKYANKSQRRNPLTNTWDFQIQFINQNSLWHKTLLYKSLAMTLSYITKTSAKPGWHLLTLISLLIDSVEEGKNVPRGVSLSWSYFQKHNHLLLTNRA